MGLLDLSELTEAISTERQRSAPSSVEAAPPPVEVPVELTDLELWANYMDEDLYELDKKVREFLRKTRYKRESKGGYRTTAQAVFAWIYGRQPEPADGSRCRTIHTLLGYYCTSVTGATTFHGKPVSRVYRFSRFSGNSKRPYSLKLRMEESDGKGNVFRNGPGSDIGKRIHGRPADREDG